MTLHPVDVHVGKRLRMRRTIMGLSQDALASSVGITCQQVQKYEAGVNRMSPGRLYDFSKILETPVTFFYDEYAQGNKDAPTAQQEGFAENPSNDFEHESMTSRETLMMVRAYYRISDPSVRRKVFELIKSLADDRPVMSDNKK